jgi:hypothetical protein
VLLAVALGSRGKQREHRILPDRRSGIDRRNAALEVPYDRRSGGERRQVVRRGADREDGSTLLQKARNRLRALGVRQQREKEKPDDGLR